MKIGISSWCFRSQPIDRALKQISLLNLKYVELFANIFHLDPRFEKVDLKKISSKLREYDLTPLSVHAPFAKIDGGGSIIKTKKVWKNLINNIFYAMDYLNISNVVVHPQVTMALPGGKQRPVDITDLLVDKTIPHADKYGIKVLIENLHPLNFNSYYTIAELEKLLFRVNRMNTGITFDTCHSICSGIDPVSEIKKNVDKIEHIHLSDNIFEPKSDRHMPIGKGSIDWSAFFSIIEKSGFKGSIILEIQAGKQPFKTVENSFNLLNHYLTK